MSERDTGDAGSQKSGGVGTSGNLSETSSQRSEQKFLKKRGQGLHSSDGEEADVLEQKRNVQEGVFACMYTLVKQTSSSSWKLSVLRIILEFLANFIVAFNSSFSAWRINRSLPVWAVVQWAVWRAPIARMYGYQTYVVVLYVMASIVLLAVVGLAWLTMAMRKQEQSKALRVAALVLNVVYELVFGICYVAFFDYFTFALGCDFLGHKQHLFFKGVACTSMPHLLHMMVALGSALLFFVVTALVVVASCNLDPVSRGLLASPCAYVRLRILVAKGTFIIFANCLDSDFKIQVVGMIAAVALIVFWNFIELPFYRKIINVIWTGLWGGVMVPCVILVILAFGKNHSDAYHKEMTQNVLYAMFPVVLGVMAITWIYATWAMRPARKFLSVLPGVKLSKVHKFKSVYEVERLARVMRKFDVDGIVDPDTAAHGETIMKAGMQAFPNSPHLLILYANFVLEVRKDGPAARTQLQLVMKQMPNIVERYQVFCTLEASKRLKDSQEGGMDLQAYIEFKRNFRAVLRVHKEVLLLQTEVWQLCMRSSLRVAQFDKVLDELEAAAGRANQVYRRVLERYPTNGKLLRCYGKFLEDVVHDQLAAARAYAGANRSGAGNALLSLDLGSGMQGGKSEFLTSMSLEDDAVVVIDAEGKILMVSQAVPQMFGYPKTELEGANVSVLMPQPFSQRHPGYLSRYVATGEARILDSVREVVALHKERYVFPVALCVTKLSGVGSDSIFLGLMRPLPPDANNLRAWIAPNGVFLCADQQFASALGRAEGDLVGHFLASVVAEPEAVATLLERCQTATAAELEVGALLGRLQLLHRYLDPVPVDVVVRMAGTDGQRILVLHCRRTDGSDGSLLAVDSHMRVRFASCEVALLLGYSMRKLATMRLDQLLPQPYNTLHAKWLRDPPHVVRPGSCRSGTVVHLLSEAGAQVPVRIRVQNVEVETAGAAGMTSVSMYAVQVAKVPPDEMFREKRLVLTTDFAGVVLAVSPPDSSVFDFPAAALVGCNMAECIDLFEDWRQRSGDAHMQMLLLALLGKEQEMPGTSWRVRIHEPHRGQAGGGAHLPKLFNNIAAGQRIARSACLQVEMEDDKEETGPAEAADGGSVDGSGSAMSRVLIKLWRRDLLNGVLELDEDLVIRRASPLTGLITGLPTAVMLRKPLSEYLYLPPASNWDELVASCQGAGGRSAHRKSALKATSDRGSISPILAFVGPHPDSGTMRLFVQGVQTLGPGGRPKVTITVHPDTTFVGAHADLMRVLKLDEVAGEEGAAEDDQGAKNIYDEDGNAEGLTSTAKSRASSAAPSMFRGKSGRRTARCHREQQDQRQGSRTRARVDEAGARHAEDSALVEQSAGKPETEGMAAPGSPPGAQEGKLAVKEADGRRQDGSDENNEEEGCGGDEDRDSDADARPTAPYHRRSSSKSEFVEQWVRSVTNHLESQQQEHRGEQQRGAEAKTERQSSGLGAAGELARAVTARSRRTTSQCLPTVPEDGGNAGRNNTGGAAGAGPAPTREGQPRERPQISRVLSLIKPSKTTQDSRIAPRVTRSLSGDGAGGRGPSKEGGPGEHLDGGGKDERASEADASSVDEGSQAASAVTGTSDATSASEVIVDTRRARLLKGLNKLLLGASFTAHLQRLRLHSSVLVLVMFVAHLAGYLVITGLLEKQHTHVYNIHRQAMAMDRSQLIVVRSVFGAFCQRANVSKTSACARPLSSTLNLLVTNIHLMETYHQGVYLGFQASKVVQPAVAVHSVWTDPWIEYQVFLDTSPSSVSLFDTGVWQLGNRFLAAAREALYFVVAMGENYKFHRTFQFIVANGLGPLFQGYSSSLEHLVPAALDSITELQRDVIIILAVEAAVVVFLSMVYETYLVARVERARLLGVLAILGLPGPVLRQLTSVETKLQVIHDSDEDSDAGGSVAGSDDDNNKNPSSCQGAGPVARGPGAGFEVAQAESAECPLPLVAIQDEQRNGTVGGSGDGRAEEDTPKGSGGVDAEDGKPGREIVLSPRTDDQAGRNLKAARLQVSRKSPQSDQTPAPVDAMKSGARAGIVRAPAIGGFGSARGRSRWLQINGKTLLPSYWNVSKFTVPFLVWNIAVVVAYSITLFQLKDLETPISTLNMASHVTFRYTRVRALGAVFVTQEDAAARAEYRSMLSAELDIFEQEYNALMYGGQVTSKVGGDTHVPAGTFASAEFAQIFFRAKRCFRYDQTDCFPPDSEYYEVTHNGLDVMVRRMVSEMRLLTLDDDADAAYNNTRYTFMAMVGGSDLYEGLQQAAQMFVDYCISHFDSIAELHTILLIVSIGLLLGFFVFLLWPHLAKMVRDASRQSALLSMVPPEVDVRGHVRAVYRRAVSKSNKAGGVGTAGRGDRRRILSR